uniref:Uncharacterized protein n=1 Tax=Opuntia streptacantha TaxID=393608 RepID=A0A7C9AAZ4_OPUST
MKSKKNIAMHEFAWSLPPMELSRENGNEPLGNIHHSLSLRKELSSILVVNEEILFVVGVAQILLQRHLAPTRTLGVLAHQTLEVNSNLPLGFHGMLQWRVRMALLAPTQNFVGCPR